MLKKLLFAGSLIALAIAVSGFGTASQWGVALPMSAVLFVLGFIVTVLEKETALYDAEHRQKPPEIQPSSSRKPVAGPTSHSSSTRKTTDYLSYEREH
ncbi:MAG TPA: hypothetical protein VFB72_07775 [Verrucomicrobiae bacterium]|nr:hypothetical protein [Verrucomicrobiae bacterium]